MFRYKLFPISLPVVIRKSILFFVIWNFLSTSVAGQVLTQTIKGTVVDLDSKSPLPGVNIVVPGTEPLKGTSTNEKGIFILTGITVGRVSLRFSSVGYDEQVLDNLALTSGKELMLNIEMK